LGNTSGTGFPAGSNPARVICGGIRHSPNFNKGKNMGRPTVLKTCEVCGETFLARSFDIKRGYGKLCSRKCMAKRKHQIVDQNQENNPNWKDGISKNSYHYKKIQIERYPERVEARNAVSYAIRRGKLKRKPCVVCGSEKVQAHHEDYLKQLEVVWLCRKHHRRLENRL
jgi:ribosomal protein S27AE